MSVRGTSPANLILASLCIAMFSANCAFARAHTDIIVMKNGDRLTGEVKQLEAGVLTVDVDYMDGSVSIDWNKVARVDSSALFLVQMNDGSIHSGTLVRRETPAGSREQIEIHTEQQTVVVDKSAVVRLTQTSEELAKRLSGAITLGTQYSKGNNTTQYTIGSELSYQTDRWGGRVNYNSNLSSSTGVPSSTRNQVDLIAYRFSPWKNYFYAGTVGFLQSSVQGIQHQSSVGIGFGRYLKNTNGFRLAIMGGFGWQGTQYIQSTVSAPSQDLAVGLMMASLEVFRFKKTTLEINASLAPALTEARSFSKVNASYYLKIFGKIDWNISFYGSWDTNPPQQLQSSDYGTSTGLSYSFGNR